MRPGLPRMRRWAPAVILSLASMVPPASGASHEATAVLEPLSAATRRAELLRARAEGYLDEISSLREARDRLDRATIRASRLLIQSLEEIDRSRQAVDELERATRELRRSASTTVLQTVRTARGEAETSDSYNRAILQLRFGDAWRRLEDRLARTRARLVAAQRAGLVVAAELAADAAAWADAGASSSAAESALREVRAGLLEAELRRTALVARVAHPTVAAIAEGNSRPDLEEMTASLEGERRRGNRSEWSGALRMPVEGTVVQRFGDRRGHQRAQGIVLAAERSQPVLAPGPGTVAFAGPFRGLGSVLIIEHGEDYHSLVIGVSKLVVGRGEVVVAGQPVGWWAGAGEGASEIYLELRKAGEPIDPLPMFTGREDEVRG